MKRSVSWAAIGRTLGLFALSLTVGMQPALAASNFIQDGASMFSSDTVTALDAQIASFQSQTGKDVLVVTVPSLNGETPETAAQNVAREQNLNGVLIFIAKNERQDYFAVGKGSAQFFDRATTQSIRASMESQFKDGDFDGGITTAVDGVLNVFRAHVNSAPVQRANSYNYPATTSSRLVTHHNGGIGSVFMWILLFVVGWLVLRSIFRAMRGPRYYGGMPPGAGGYGPGYGPGPGYGGYGGPGYYGGGGGGFWSGLLGGLGGAWLGNEMFGNRGNTTIIEDGGGNMIQGDQGGSWGSGNPGGWSNDGGQIDTGASSGGDFSGGGFGDFGGGGGGDFGGGGGGDSGGGW